jgi:Protein of unknown function (DUF1822)
MIDPTEQDLTLPVPLTLQAHYAALLFYQKQSDPHKAKQVYLNTLAIAAVRAYLSWLGTASDLQASDSWNPTLQALADVADLDIPGQGKLECRPVLPESTVCYVPPETWSNRIGYIAVLLDADLKTATLLGFVPSVDTEELPLDRLQSIATLLDIFKPQKQPQQNKELVNLSQWAQGMFTKSWQTVEELLEPQPVLSFRSVGLASNLKPSGLTTRGKLLELVPRSLSHQVVLLVGLIPNNSFQLDIWIKLAPTNCDAYLPEDLEIKVLDEHGVAVMQAQSRQTDMLQLHFQGTIGEKFSIELELNNINLVETFII